MLRKIIGIAVALAVPVILAAQTPTIPNAHASDTAKAKVAEQRHPRAKRHRGSVVGSEHRNPNAATPATPATRATPATPTHGAGPATPASPATPATPAVPAKPSQKPSNPGQSGSHRP